MNKKIFNHINLITFILVFCVGWIDIIAFKLFVFDRTGFHSAKASVIGESLFTGDIAKIALLVTILLAFIFGAFIGTKITMEKGCKSGLLVTSFSLIVSYFMKDATIFLIPFALGCMNASTSLTKVSRTTHLSGPTTDIGMHLAKGEYDKAIFYALRWIALPLGAFIGLILLEKLPLIVVFLAPSIIIGLVAIIFDKYLTIV